MGEGRMEEVEYEGLLSIPGSRLNDEGKKIMLGFRKELMERIEELLDDACFGGGLDKDTKDELLDDFVKRAEERLLYLAVNNRIPEDIFESNRDAIISDEEDNVRESVVYYAGIQEIERVKKGTD